MSHEKGLQAVLCSTESTAELQRGSSQIRRLLAPSALLPYWSMCSWGSSGGRAYACLHTSAPLLPSMQGWVGLGIKVTTCRMSLLRSTGGPEWGPEGGCDAEWKAAWGERQPRRGPDHGHLLGPITCQKRKKITVARFNFYPLWTGPLRSGKIKGIPDQALRSVCMATSRAIGDTTISWKGRDGWKIASSPDHGSQETDDGWPSEEGRGGAAQRLRLLTEEPPTGRANTSHKPCGSLNSRPNNTSTSALGHPQVSWQIHTPGSDHRPGSPKTGFGYSGILLWMPKQCLVLKNSRRLQNKRAFILQRSLPATLHNLFSVQEWPPMTYE